MRVKSACAANNSRGAGSHAIAPDSALFVVPIAVQSRRMGAFPPARGVSVFLCLRH